MSTARVSLQAAYVLHHRPYRDTSVLIEAFTADFGRVGLVARGARSSRSRSLGLLQPFQPLLISWSGRGELVTLTGCESAGLLRKLRGPVVMSGFYINELLLRLLHRHDAHPALFHAYAATLQALEDAGQEQRALRLFEKRLLQEIGYALVLDHEAGSGEALVADKTYEYQLEQGPVSHDAVNAGELIVQGRSLLSLAHEELHDALSLREAKHLLRAALALYLGDKPLHSRKLLMDFHRATAAPAEHGPEPLNHTPN